VSECCEGICYDSAYEEGVYTCANGESDGGLLSVAMWVGWEPLTGWRL
jgi:hypothetical protein